MSGILLRYNTGEYVGTPTGADLVEKSVELCKEALKTYSGGQKCADYDVKNKTLKDAMLTYAVERANIDTTMLDVKTDLGFEKAFKTYSNFRQMFFSVMQEALQKVNSKKEIQQIMTHAEIKNGAEGDSENFLLQPNNIITFEGVGYSSNATRHQFYLADNETILPERKEASVGLDLYQWNAGFYDYGQMLADIAIGMRRSLQLEVATKLFNQNDLTGTPFLLSGFAKETWMDLNEKISAVNGIKSVAYGTQGAFGKITDGLDSKYFYGGLGEKILAEGIIKNVYGTQGIVLDQSVNVNDTNYEFDLPSDRILIASGGDKLIKVFMEGNVYIQEDDGKNNSLMKKSYRIMTSWGSKKITQNIYGMVLV